MRRLLAIVLLALLPLQFSWAAVASYCAHEVQAGAGDFGHHEHQHHGAAGVDAHTDTAADPTVDPDPEGDKTPAAMDVDCGHCHGHCSAMLMLSAGLPGVLVAAPPSAATNEAGAAHAPTRPERPQWRPLA